MESIWGCYANHNRFVKPCWLSGCLFASEHQGAVVGTLTPAELITILILPFAVKQLSFAPDWYEYCRWRDQYNSDRERLVRRAPV